MSLQKSCQYHYYQYYHQYTTPNHPKYLTFFVTIYTCEYLDRQEPKSILFCSKTKKKNNFQKPHTSKEWYENCTYEKKLCFKCVLQVTMITKTDTVLLTIIAKAKRQQARTHTKKFSTVHAVHKNQLALSTFIHWQFIFVRWLNLCVLSQLLWQFIFMSWVNFCALAICICALTRLLCTGNLLLCTGTPTFVHWHNSSIAHWENYLCTKNIYGHWYMFSCIEKFICALHIRPPRVSSRSYWLNEASHHRRSQSEWGRQMHLNPARLPAKRNDLERAAHYLAARSIDNLD